MIEKAKDNLYLFMPLKLSLIKDYDEEIRDYYITSNGNL